MKKAYLIDVYVWNKKDEEYHFNNVFIGEDLSIAEVTYKQIEPCKDIPRVEMFSVNDKGDVDKIKIKDATVNGYIETFFKDGVEDRVEEIKLKGV